MKKTVLLIALNLCIHAYASVHECAVAQKLSPERTYTPEEIRRNAFTIKLEQLPGEAYVSRCSLSVSKGKVTCDRYRVDRVEIDRFIGARKFNLFSAQFDFQLFKN